jgi:hypothetical protein
MQGKATPRNLRRGLRRLECADCTASIYASFSQLEQHGIPTCACGGRFVPDDLELALALGVDAPAVAEYERELSRILHGQASHGLRGRELRPAESIAAERVERSRRELAAQNRLNALRPAVAAMPF